MGNLQHMLIEPKERALEFENTQGSRRPQDENEKKQAAAFFNYLIEEIKDL